MNEKKISVIIPTYNRAHSIKASIASVLNQTYPIDEVIIADDYSTDETESVISSMDDSRIKYCRLPENKGAGGARNYGVSMARNEYIAFHDSDDLWLPTKIEKQISLWEANPEYGLIYTAYKMILIYGYEHIVPSLSLGNMLHGNIFQYLLVKNSIGAPTILTTKSIFNSVGGFDESMRSLEDWDFAIKIAKKYPIGFVSEPLLTVSQSENGVSSNRSAYYQSRCYMLGKYKADYIQTNTFNETASDILEMAKEEGILAQIEKMMMLYLSQ